jgi:Cdc6-like AAA superfamily ATPase
MAPELEALSFKTGSVFTPGAPINEMDLFAGRREQVEKIIDAVSQRGCHAILYGERGVGKTSLSNMISAFLAHRLAFVISRTNCDISDSFSSLWTKALKDIEASKRQPQVGFPNRQLAPPSTLAVLANLAPQSAPATEALTPDSVRRVLQELSTTASLIVIFDEFDRIKNTDVITAMADTIKALSDNSVNATILLIGVADSVNELIREHQSIERALVQIPMPRMSDHEIRGIIDKGLARLTMAIDDAAREDLVLFSQGVPYIAHLLCIYTCRAALAAGRKTIYSAHVEQGVNRSLDQWQQSVKTLYSEATQSPQPRHIYKEVLLACALAEVDELRYFTTAAVKKPLSQITNRNYETINYARHLKDLSEPARGRVLQRVGESFRLRYRISNPILRPYIIMRGIKDKVIAKAQIPEWKRAADERAGAPSPSLP